MYAASLDAGINFSAQVGRNYGSSNFKTAFHKQQTVKEKAMPSITIDQEDPRVSNALRAQAKAMMKKGLAVAFVVTGRTVELFVEDVPKVWEHYLSGGNWKYYLPE